jgi:4-hydroxy-2-oxoheptanedioate aldolase
MQLPTNKLKRGLREGRAQIGLWCSLVSPIATEVVAGAGFDWVLIDMEHAANEVNTVLAQLHAVSASGVSPIVRQPANDPVLTKRLLDIGVQSFLIPMVNSAEEARQVVAATRYPPHGMRGVATATRASQFGRIKDYHKLAQNEICVIVQVETREALAQLDAIAAVEGVDCVFIGPSDLSAALGHLGNSSEPSVREAIAGAFKRIQGAGKAAGILTGVEADAKHWLELGALFCGVGADIGILARQSEALAAKFGLPRK